MTSWNEMEQLGRNAAQARSPGRGCVDCIIGVVFITAVVILSKRHVTDYLWIDFAAFAVPILIVFCFKKDVALLRYLYLCCRHALGAAIQCGI